MLVLTLAARSQDASEIVPPEVRLKSYTQNYTYGGGYSYSGYWYGTTWSTSGGSSAWNNVNWNSASGGYESYGSSYSGNWTSSDWGAYTFGGYYDVTTTWPAPPALGTMVYTNSWYWSCPDGQGGTIGDTNGSAEVYPDIPQPGGYPWRYAQTHQVETYNSSDSDGQWSWTNSWSWSASDSTRTHIDLHTGGATNSTAENLFVLNVSAYNAETGETIDPTVIQIRGEYADTNGVVALTLNDNGIYDVTPTLPAAYTNYYFNVVNPYSWNPQLYMTFDDELIAMQSNIWIYPDLIGIATSGTSAPVALIASAAAASAAPTWTNGVNKVTDQNVQKIIGGRVTIDALPVIAEPSAKFEWIIPPAIGAVSDWSAAWVAGSGITNAAGYVTNIVVTNSSLTFFPTVGGTNFEIRCNIKIGTTNLAPLRTRLTVVQPDVSFTCTKSGSVEVSTNYAGGTGTLLGKPALHFGRGTDSGSPGVLFHYKINKKPAIPVDFELALLQLGDGSEVENFTDGTSIVTSTTGNDFFATPLLFANLGSADTGSVGDAPASKLRSSAPPLSSFQRADKFRTYLLFQAGGIRLDSVGADTVPVPLKRVRWKWLGVATNSTPTDQTAWQKLNATPVPVVEESNALVPFAQFPRWASDYFGTNINDIVKVTNSFLKPLPDLGGF